MPKENILIIDDEPVILNVASEILQKADYRVTTAGDGLEGYHKIKEGLFDLIITDIKMPKMNGMDLIHKIRQEISTDIPIIIMTGHGTIDIAIESLKHGTHDFIMKPFTSHDLRESVEDAIRKSNLIKENIKLKALLPIFEVNKRLLSELNIERLMQSIAAEAARYTGAERVSLMLMDRQDGCLTLKASIGMGIYPDEPIKIKPGEGISGWVAEKMKPLLLNESIGGPLKDMMKKNEIKSALCMPIIVKGEMLGVLNLSNVNNARIFTHSDMETIYVLCGQAGIAIENARLYEKIENSYIGIIETLANAIEARDPRIAGHAMRMADYSCSIAAEMGISEAEIELINKAALLHDIGKIGIPDSILLKPENLTDEERIIMERHSEIGVKILDRIEGFKEIRRIIRHHHEFYNGDGYPLGLKGGDIPLGSRIIAVADAFEAMTTAARLYREPVQPIDAVNELKRMGGIQFDPQVVDVLAKALRGKGAI